MSLTPRLRHRVTLQAQTSTQDPNTGDPVIGWADFMSNIPAEVLTGAGREARVTGTTVADTDARITMRWFPALDQSMRLLWDGRIYDITSIETDATGRREWRLRCTEGLTDGR